MAIKKAISEKKYTFAKYPDILDLPNLIEIQKESYDNFLQMAKPPEARANEGLQAVFLDVFPIVSHDGLSSLEFVSYSLSPPKYSVIECQKRGMTYAASLKAKIRLVLYEEDPQGNKQAIAIKEQDVFVGELPLMTEKGTFIINGAERVVVSQLHRSPGVCFEEKQHPSGRMLLSGRIIPYRGAWVEFEFDINDVLYMHIDRRTRIPATAFLRALGYESDDSVVALFYEVEEVKLGQVKAMTEGSRFDIEELVDRTLAKDVVDVDTGEVLATTGEKITKKLLTLVQECGIKVVSVVKFKSPNETTALFKTLSADHIKTTTEALIELYRRIRPGDPATVNTAKTLFEKTFFDPSRYNLSPVGRYKINRKLDLDIPMETLTLRPEDVMETIRYLIKLKNGQGQIDDIDHLGNRRVRSVGELLANQIRIGLVRMERTIKERMNFQEMDAVTPQSLINPKPVSAVIKDFFGRSQLSHFMDQTNPLAELTHKRRLSALGPGGLSRERAGFEVRDVHPTHYGRICPVETPEGPNIGLMASLSTYARINKFGFLETPYRKVEKGRVTEKIDYLSAYEEDRYVIAQANAPLDKRNHFANEFVLCRHMGDFRLIPPDKIDYMDVSPKQLVSIAAALVPFLEHDDANRALMGSNMQRQAVPLLVSEAPYVETGLEMITAKNSGAVIVAEHNGTVESVTAERIIVRRRGATEKDGPQEDIYWLQKFVRSNQGTCTNQKPIVREGDRVKKGDIIADGPATEGGELALGRNVLVAFMPWEGYNFEDAILVSEKIVKEDVFTSLHIEEFEIEARDTKLGREEITRDIPNVGEEALKDLDEDGIVRIGAEVRQGDILVGKVSPKGETELAPEEKLLRAIFGEKAENVRDASLRVPPGIEGTVIDVKVFSRKERAQDEKTRISEKREQKKIDQRYVDGATEEVIFKQRHIIHAEDLEKAKYEHLFQLKVSDKDIETGLEKLILQTQERENKLLAEKEQSLDLLKKGDELPPGVIKMVKVYIAAKRKLSVGDKMAGRHGNKGVVAKILPEEDMPFLPDGTPVEIILNPLGVPSRMNVGQIMETHLGWATQKLGLRVISPVFGGANEQEIKAFLGKAGLPQDGKSVLFDGRTGRPFDQKVTVGYIYMMKLAHLVDDKIHARAIGPYSLVTQQPLGGKAQFGGQRFGEMEVWALEAYGAANILQELLTIKSDDVTGRAKAYEAIVKGQQHLETGTPESFNVLLKEMQGLCLDVQKLKKEQDAEDKRPAGGDSPGEKLS
ncbi:MAG: DNA-directed RNA polymerase subunit beta [Candidatus Lindowbacteria bacterium]|nr:DNA-directed RNA polymerase subunit beta [Candidatus Lindowbacteria bacterium]